MSSTDRTASSLHAVEPLTTVEQVQLAVSAAESRKAERLRVLDLSKVSDITDYFLIANGTNERQVQAIADAILERLRASGLRPLHVEGYNRARWVLLDFGGDFVVHVFQPETRKFYGLERLWSDAPDRTGGFVDGAPAGGTGDAADEGSTSAAG